MKKAVEIVRDNLTLRGMLQVPDGRGKKIPGIAAFHGFTGHKAESHFIFTKLSNSLEKSGIASVRFDFACSGESDGDFEEMTPETELKDAKAILDYLLSLDFIDSKRVGICGLSMGGYIAGITAGDNKDRVKSLCLWAPAGNMKYIFKDVIDNNTEVSDGVYELNGFKLGRGAYESACRIDHISRTKAFEGKTCIIRGTNDTAVPGKFVEEYVTSMKDVEFHSIDGADHTFSRSDWEKEAIDLTTGFFKRNL